MIVIDRRALDELVVGVVEARAPRSTSSAAWTISTFFSKPSASTSMASSGSVWVSVAISPSSISFLITSAADRPERLGHLLDGGARLDRGDVDLLDLGSAGVQVGLDPRGPAPAAAAAGRLLLGRRRAGARREAWESITTRRRLPPPRRLRPRRRGRRGWDAPRAGSALLRRGAVAALALRRRGLRGRCLGGLLGLLGLLIAARRPPPLAGLARSKARAMSFSSTLEAAAFTSKPAFWRISEDLLAGDPLLLRYFVDALLCHSRMKSKVSSCSFTGARNERASAFSLAALSAQASRRQT